MTADPRDSVSEITEIEDIELVRSSDFPPTIAEFFASLFWGVFAGTVTLIGAMIVFSPDPTRGLEHAIMGGLLFVALFATIFAVAGMVVIGLPATLVLKQLRLEYRAIYTVLGAAAVFAVIAFTFEIQRWGDSELIILPISGAVAGGACASRWGRFRQRVGRRRRHNPQPEPRQNPFHDMIH